MGFNSEFKGFIEKCTCVLAYLNLRKINVLDIFFFFTNWMHKFFILIHLLHSSTCFERYYPHLQEDNCISTASGIVTVFR